MTRLHLSLCTLAAFGMAGCTTHYDPPLARGRHDDDIRFGLEARRRRHPDHQSRRTAPAQASASAGGITSSAVSGPYRMTLRMDDGTVQTLVVDNRARVLVGDRVQVTRRQ